MSKNKRPRGKKSISNNNMSLFPDEAIPEVPPVRRPPPGKTLICRPWITLKNGTVLHASQCGKKAFCFYVDA